MRNFIVSLFLFASLSSFAQTMPTANGDILTYEVFDAKQGFLQTEITFQPYKPGRTLKLNIESNGERSYTFLNGRPFAIYDKSFLRTSIRGVAVSPGEYFVLLPKDKKIEAGAKWEFSRSGYGYTCGNWKGDYLSVAKEGPEITLSIDGKNTPIKTLRIEISGEVLQGDVRCTTLTSKKVVHYAPELNEIIMEQAIDTKQKTLAGGYRWVLKSITTSASQAVK